MGTVVIGGPLALQRAVFVEKSLSPFKPKGSFTIVGARVIVNALDPAEMAYCIPKISYFYLHGVSPFD